MQEPGSSGILPVFIHEGKEASNFDSKIKGVALAQKYFIIYHVATFVDSQAAIKVKINPYYDDTSYSMLKVARSFFCIILRGVPAHS